MATPRHHNILTKAIHGLFLVVVGAAAALIPSVTSHGSAQYESPSQDAGQFMGPQNAARAHLGLKPLTWDTRLESYAVWWANERRGDCALTHSNGPYGENLFWGSGTSWSPAQAAYGWLSEAKNYNYFSNSCVQGQMCGHYTQIVWRATQRIGCARVLCDNGGGVFFICNYDPPGNFLGKRPY